MILNHIKVIEYKFEIYNIYYIFQMLIMKIRCNV